MKKIIGSLIIAVLTLVSCSSFNKTIVIHDDVYMTELENSNKITREKLEIEVEDGFVFNAGFFSEEKIYGVLLSTEENSSENYRAYYSSEDGLVKMNKIEMWEAYAEEGYLQSGSVINNFSNTKKAPYSYRNNVTNEEIDLPRLNIDFTNSDGNINISLDEENNNNYAYNIEYTDLKYSVGEINDTRDGVHKVIGSEEYYARPITKLIYDENKSEDIRDVFGRINFNSCDSYASSLVIYDIYENKVILPLENKDIPYIKNVMYSNSNGKFYAIGGEREQSVYEIIVNEDRYTLKLIYTFDSEDARVYTYMSKIVGNSILFNIQTQNNEKYMLLNLDNLEVNTFQESDEIIYINKNNSKQYLIITVHNEENSNDKDFLVRVVNNKLEYLYEFDYFVSKAVFNEAENRIFIEYKENTENKYEIINLNLYGEVKGCGMED